MKIKYLVAFLICMGLSPLYADAIDQLNIGIGQDNVFSDATPSPFKYPKTKAGKSPLIAKAYPTVPPLIPHRIDKYVPITADDNGCTDCHDQPNKIGRTKHRTGKKIPMPKSHYGGFKGNGDKQEISGARYNCTQCHVPQSNAKPLVENTYTR